MQAIGIGWLVAGEPDLCLIDIEPDGRRWRIAATRSGYLVSWREMIAVCRTVDIVVTGGCRRGVCRGG
ncbi:hypothetical protein OK349_06490 [Sphingomonas sp. BT-65]|uniref:hypothetical protein n=1 Tax=Sphingomonas sp. BT-65 TaxID=2989821 RepID=UPI00223582F0|nr:hypothetical protein [Sphingomonas sp. BT-65]MCW4461349.1 hypothetical protein [Sphingomonas sp. BT-65]